MSRPRPDWFFLLSGGVDSTAAAIVANDAIRENYRKTPIGIYLDTGVGVPFQRIYVEALADFLGIQLWTLRTSTSYAERIEENGYPGPSDHGRTQNKLKGEQRDKLVALADDPVFVTGIRADESPQRAATPKGEKSDRDGRECWFVKPVFEKSKDWCRDVIEEAGAPENPLWGESHFADCACGAFGAPEELIEAEANGFEYFVQRIREYGEAVAFGDRRDEWGWGGLDPDARTKLDHALDDDQLSLCGPSCGNLDDILYDDLEVDDHPDE